MHVDWVTVVAQVVNFLVLVWLLKRFLYAPVLSAMERRRRRVAERLEEAARREREADEARGRHERLEADLAQRRETLLAQARDEAADRRREWLEQARGEVQAARLAWRHDLERERADTRARLRQAVADAALDAASQLLGELSDSDLDHQMVRRFIARLETLDEDALTGLAGGGGPLRVRSARELDPALRARLSRALHERIGVLVPVEYAVTPELLAGIEVDAGGLHVGWSLAERMQGLERRLWAQLRVQSREDESRAAASQRDMRDGGARNG